MGEQRCTVQREHGGNDIRGRGGAAAGGHRGWYAKRCACEAVLYVVTFHLRIVGPAQATEREKKQFLSY